MTENGFETFLEMHIGRLPEDLANYKIAFVHPSYDSTNNYQRLEFLGDAVLNLAMTHIVFEDNAGCDEGFLTKERMSMVRKEVLSRVSDVMGFKNFILLGKGEETDLGREKDSILADVFEAFVAALYMDMGFPFVLGWMRSNMYIFRTASEGIEDYKSTLQELMQSRKQDLPRYVITREEGMAHKKTFYVELYIGDAKCSDGFGLTKKAAEQSAAKLAFYKLIQK
jgi:ribonuclease-3